MVAEYETQMKESPDQKAIVCQTQQAKGPLKEKKEIEMGG